jgi:hypothetical protein
MNVMTFSVEKMRRALATLHHQTRVWSTLTVLLASSLAPAQTSSVSQRPRKPLPEAKPAVPAGAAEIASPSGYVDGASRCLFRTGERDCSLFGGPFRKVGEGVRGVSPGGTLFIRGGVYSEPIVLNKQMEIRAYDGTARIAPSSLAPFDLVADTVDDNGLPLNPKWGAQRKNPPALPDPEQCPQDPGSYPCTNQFTYKDYEFPEIGGGCGPHINWFGVTYEGNIFWQDYSSADSDYNMKLITVDQAGYSASTNFTDKIHCEFDSEETIDHFDSPWWSRFQKAVDDDDSRARQMINEDKGAVAIVTALMGFDDEHGVHVELHPVWALAMNVQPSVDDDLWTFFVRNWGNQGYCGKSQHFVYFPNNRYTFRLPWKPGATSVSITSQSVGHAYHIQNPSWNVKAVPGQGVFVTFTLDAPREDGSLWDGELHLKWVGQGLTVEPRAKRPHFTERPKREEAEYEEAAKKKAKKRVNPEGIVVKPEIR